MDNAEFDKHVELIASMTTNRMMGGINRQTYLSNLKMISRKMEECLAPEPDGITTERASCGCIVSKGYRCQYHGDP